MDTAQCAQRQALHLVLRLHQLAGHAPLDMRPDLLVGIEVGRVRRQVKKLEFSLLGPNEVLDQFGFVDRTLPRRSGTERRRGVCNAETL